MWTLKLDYIERRSVSEESDTRQIQFEGKATGESKEEGGIVNNAGF